MQSDVGGLLESIDWRITMREIYNQGRVVGYSAYELYVRQHISEDPDSEPLTERQWLSMNLGTGVSAIIKLDNNSIVKTIDGYNIHEINLPQGSLLFAASTVVGSLFIGSAHFSGNSLFADYVESYGSLIPNTAASHPDDSALPLPTKIDSIDAATKSYRQIVDGVVFTRTKWEESGKQAPYMDCSPGFNTTDPTPVVRILTYGEFTEPVQILLSGFMLKSGLAGLVDDSGSTNTPDSINSDFLGPAVLPWAAKIVFSIPSAADAGKTYVSRSTDGYVAHVELGSAHTRSIALQDDAGAELTRTAYDTFDDNSPELGDKPLTWNLLMSMLASDKGTDILGNALRQLRSNLPNLDTTPIGPGVLKLSGTGESKVGGKLSSGDNYPIHTGTQYIEFRNGLRLYISNTAPTDNDIPIGSIGIGW